ncbi:MAG: hypothetical protein AAF950_05405 [Pseudomonadota bacterium]
MMLYILQYALIFLIILLIFLIIMKLWRGGGWGGGGEDRGPDPGDPGFAKTLTDDVINKATGKLDGLRGRDTKVPVRIDDDA